MKINSFKFILSALLTIMSATLFAQQPQLQPLPMDPKIRYGKLDNGLTYYIRANKEPKERAEFHIAQNVGAILENDDQNGLAHFLEHMAFNGTKNFPGKGIINYFEKNGVKFGYDINAYTSLDETVYRLSNVPTNREGLLDSALLVMHDWSNFILLQEDEIDSERGVIREEWRTGNNAFRRMWKQSNAKKYPGSQYAKRDIIGDTAVINNFTYQTLRDYYKKWYRPDQQAIVVVGDIDVDKMEAKIKQMFSDISKKDNAGERPVYEIANNKEPIISIVTDPEASRTQIELEYKKDKLPREVKLAMPGYAMGLVNSLISSVLSERFEEMAMQADAPFAGASGSYGELVKSKDAFQMSVVPKEGKELEGLKALLLEAEKMKRFGFTNAELERAKTNMLKNFEKSYNERDNQKSMALAEEFIRNFLTDEPIPGIEFEYQTAQMLLPQLKTEMINQLAKSYIADTNLVVSITAPEKAGVIVPTQEQVLAALDDTRKAELTAKAEEVLNKPLLDKAPKAGKVKKIKQNLAMETTEMILSNGVKIVFKPTTFKKDEISFTAFSDGGISKVHNVADLPSASMADRIVQANGIGNFSAVELGKVLTGKIASVNPYIDQYEEGMNGNSSVKDFETMLQLLYLYFTQPRKDDNSFTAIMNMYRTQLANAASNPNKAFSDSIKVTTSANDPRTVLQNLQTVEKVDQDKAIEIYKQRFANPADFTFIFVGNIDPNNKETQQLLATYLGGLKTDKKNTEKFDKVYREFPKGKVNKYFTFKMKTKKASNRIYYTADIPFNINNQVAVSAIGDILDIRYLESIREKEGGSYGVGVYGGMANVPKDQASILMQFDTDPEKQVKLMGIIHDEIRQIIDKGPLKDDLDKVKENLMKQYKQDMEQNNWWRGKLKAFYQDGLNYRTDYKAAVDALTSESIQKTLKSIVDQQNVIEIVMKPAAE
ncbi:MAG: peptidase domain protein [Bacteroidetes bacterium]|nr:peptidase domain protein [Bacteroidota bacterium]